MKLSPAELLLDKYNLLSTAISSKFTVEHFYETQAV